MGISKKSMTFLYEGRFDWGEVKGTARGGNIFKGYSSGFTWDKIEASYERGFVYDTSITGWTGKVIGRYQNGFLYRGTMTSMFNCIGRYENGFIYEGTTMFAIDIIGCYKGSDDEGAALGLAFLFKLR